MTKRHRTLKLSVAGRDVLGFSAAVPQSHASAADSTPAAPSGGVQSLERAFDLLERMADAGGEIGLSELSASSGLPLPTIHRLMRTLVACGYYASSPTAATHWARA